jgi:hypothetical protein
MSAKFFNDEFRIFSKPFGILAVQSRSLFLSFLVLCKVDNALLLYGCIQ